MVERLEPVVEVIVVLPDEYSIAASMIIHSRQSRPRVRLPLTILIPLILRLRYLPQVPDAVVEAVAVDMIYLQRRKPPVVPSPDGDMHSDTHTLVIDAKTHIHITVYAISLCALSASHHLARPLIHELSAAVVVVVILLDASRQCGQLAIR